MDDPSSIAVVAVAAGITVAAAAVVVVPREAESMQCIEDDALGSHGLVVAVAAADTVVATIAERIEQASNHD